MEETSAPSPKQSEQEDNSSLEPRRRLVHFFLSVVIFLTASLIVGVFYVRNQRAIEEEFQSALLPPGMPRVVPFPKKLLTIEDTHTEDYAYTIDGEGVSSEEQKGIKYTIEGSSDLSPNEVRDFYNDLLLDKGFRQRINISLPGGHRVDLVSDEHLVSVEAERKSGETKTRVKIIVYD